MPAANRWLVSPGLVIQPPSPMTATAPHDLAHGEHGAVSLESLWMPFTANRAFKRAPRLLASAKQLLINSLTASQRLLSDLSVGSAGV